MSSSRLTLRNLPVLNRMRVLTNTFAYGKFSRLSLAAVGREWGEGEWTARDLWERSR